MKSLRSIRTVDKWKYKMLTMAWMRSMRIFRTYHELSASSTSSSWWTQMKSQEHCWARKRQNCCNEINKRWKYQLNIDRWYNWHYKLQIAIKVLIKSGRKMWLYKGTRLCKCDDRRRQDKFWVQSLFSLSLQKKCNLWYKITLKAMRQNESWKSFLRWKRQLSRRSLQWWSLSTEWSCKNKSSLISR